MTSITGPLFAGGCIESSSSSTVLKQQDHMMLLNEGGSLQQSGAKRNSLSSASGGAHSTASSRSSSIKSNRGLGTNNKQHSPTSSTNSNNIYYTNEIENVTQCSLCKKKLREPKLLDCLHVYCKSCLASIAQPSSGMVEASSNQHHHLMMPSPPSSASSSTSHTPNQLPPASIALISPTPSSSSTSSASSVSSASHLVISCPKCKQDTITKSVESLENDYVMNNILDMKAMDEQALKCLSCTNDQIAMARCSDCACFLCVACVKAHKYMVCFHDHVVLEFAQIQSQYAANLARHQQQQQPHKSASACDLLAPIGHRSLSPNQNETQESASSTSLVPIHRPLNCRFHAKEALKFFCNTCQMPVCSECVISEHTQPTHVYERLGDVELARHADEIEAYVRKALEMCSSSSGHDENNSASLEKNITYLDEQMQSAREAIEETYETFKSMLDKRRNIMLNELEDRFKDKQTKLIEMHAQIDASMAKLNDVIKFAERVMQNGNSTEILLMKRAIVNQIRFLVRSLPPNNDLEATLDLNIRFGSDESRFERALVDTFGRFYTQKEIKHSYLNNLANMSNAMLNGSGSANSLIAADRDRDSLSFQQQQQQQQQFSISRQQQLQQQQQLANLQQLQQHIQQQIGSNGMNTSPRNGQAENFFDPEWQALVIQAQQQQQQQQGANQQQMKPPLLDDQLLTLKVLAQQLSASSNEECFANMMKLNNDVAKLAISPPSSSVGLTQQQHVKTMWPTSSSAASSSASSTTSSKFIMNSGGSQSGSNQHSRTHTPAPQIGNQLTMDEMMLMQFSSSAGSSSSSSSSAAPMASNPIAAQNFTQLSKFMSTTTTTATNNLPPGGLVPQPHHHHPLISPTGANMNINDLASLGSTIDLNSLSAVGFTNAYMQAMAMSNNGVDQQLQSSSQSPPLLSTNGAANPVGAIGSCIPSSTHSASSSVATVTASTAAVNGQYSGNGNLNPPVRQTAKMTNMQIRTKFGILGAGKAQFNAPHGFCLGVDEEIIVADTNNHRIQIFDKNGEWKFMFGSPGRDEGQLWYPRKVAVMRESGKFVVCDRGNERSRMQIFNKSGHFIKKISIRYIDIVAGLGITSNGEIVAVDSVSPTVFRISENGDLLKWFDCSDYMREPSDIAIWGNEYYVCDFKGHCVVVFNEDGSFVRRIGGENITNFPNGIDVSDQGDVLVGDSHGNRFHVAVFAPKGDLISEFECPYVKVSRCCGLKITSEGYVVTLAKNNHHVLVLNTLYVG